MTTTPRTSSDFTIGPLRTGFQEAPPRTTPESPRPGSTLSSIELAHLPTRQSSDRRPRMPLARLPSLTSSLRTDRTPSSLLGSTGDPRASTSTVDSLRSSAGMGGGQAAHVGFGEGFLARTQGAAPVEAIHALTDFFLSTIEAAATHGRVGEAALQSAVGSGLLVGSGALLHAGISAATQLPAVQRKLDSVFGDTQPTKEQMLQGIRVVSAMLSAIDSVGIGAASATAAAKILGLSTTGTAVGLAVLNAAVASGFVGAAGLALYKTNPAFREQVDGVLRPLADKLASMTGQNPGRPGVQGPPVLAQAPGNPAIDAVSEVPARGGVPSSDVHPAGVPGLSGMAG
jgi:hypothetical protein